MSTTSRRRHSDVTPVSPQRHTSQRHASTAPTSCQRRATLAPRRRRHGTAHHGHQQGHGQAFYSLASRRRGAATLRQDGHATGLRYRPAPALALTRPGRGHLLSSTEETSPQEQLRDSFSKSVSRKMSNKDQPCLSAARAGLLGREKRSCEGGRAGAGAVVGRMEQSSRAGLPALVPKLCHPSGLLLTHATQRSRSHRRPPRPSHRQLRVAPHLRRKPAPAGTACQAGSGCRWRSACSPWRPC